MTSAAKRIFLFAQIAGTLAATSQPSPTPLTALVQKIGANIDAEHALETMRTVYSTDRWFTFPKFEETARYLRSRLEANGLEDVEIGGARADGRTQAGFWTEPLAWDAKSATLDVTAPERIRLCDYQAVPSSLGMWSGSTPKGGVDAELVDIRTTPWPQVAGKLVLTDKNAAGYKHQLVKYHAMGAVNGFSENPSLRDGRQWINAWGDNGWGFTAASTPLLSFSVTPRQAEHLRQLLRGGKVVVHATVDTRYYSGRYPWVTGVLHGRERGEEVLVLGHSSEQGAQDNATGVAAMTEALATLSRLIRNGTLPRPQRSMRILLMPELYGSLSYISEHSERMQHTAAAITIDAPAASYDLAGTEYTFHLNPHVAMSYHDALVLRIAHECLPSARPWHWAEFEPGTDSYLSDPTIGVPDIWPYSGTGPVTHHNSADTPDTVDPRSLRDLTAIIATYLYFNADAGMQQAPWLAQIAFEQSAARIHDAASAGIDAHFAGNTTGAAYACERVDYFAQRAAAAIHSVLRIVPPAAKDQIRRGQQTLVDQVHTVRDAETARLRQAGVDPSPTRRNSEAERIVVHRKRRGTLPLDDLPRDEWQGFPSGAWDNTATIALYWCDGKRNLAEVIHLTEMEVGPTDFNFVGYFRFLASHGYVDLRPVTAP